MAFGAGVLGHAVMNWSLQQIPLWLGSTFTLLVPVISTAVAWAFLDEPVTGVQVSAIVLVLVALTGVITGQAGVGSRPVRYDAEFSSTPRSSVTSSLSSSASRPPKMAAAEPPRSPVRPRPQSAFAT